jgi:hypothetical protein
MVILALMVVRFILRVFAAHFYLALPDLLRCMCLPRSIISLRRDGLLQRNVVRPPGAGAAGGEINLRKTSAAAMPRSTLYRSKGSVGMTASA